MSDIVFIFLVSFLSFFIGSQTARVKTLELEKLRDDLKTEAEKNHQLWQEERRSSAALQRRIDHEMSLRSRQDENHRKEIDAISRQLEDAKMEISTYKAKWCDEVTKRHMEMLRQKTYGGEQS